MVTLMTQTFWAYLAGLIDGEASLGIYPSHKYVRLDISNTNIKVLKGIQTELGCGNIQISQRQRPCGHLMFGAEPLRWMLPELMPYLRIKRRLAELLLKYINDGYWVRGHTPPRWELTRRERIITKVRSINGQRGI
jgi:hypothetical protein